MRFDAITGLSGAPAAQAAQPPARPAEQPDSRRVAQDFTAVLVNQVVKQMFESISEDGEGPFGSGPGADIYRGMAEQAFSQALAENGLEPLVDRIHRQIDAAARRMAPAAGQEERTG